jgi:hypothetical protein
MPKALTGTDLNRELAALGERFHRLGEDDLFILWFLRARVTENEEEAARALVGVAGDKAVDAVLIDERAKVVVLVQGKYRREIGQKHEARGDVLAFAELSERLWEDGRAYREFEKGLDPAVRDLLREARERLHSRQYTLHLVFLTTGRVSKTERRDASSIVRRADGPGQFEVVDASRVLVILTDYIAGVAPAVPSVEIFLESGDGVQTQGPLQRTDGRTGIESWVFAAKGLEIGTLFEKYRDRIFARNVRGFQGSTEVNDSMLDTLQECPELFWYFNNGVTIVCDDAELLGSSGRQRLRVDNPQIINGQQTTRMLHSVLSGAHAASVLVRVIRIPRKSARGDHGFDELVDQIVKSTNWQNYISEADLRSNDHRQVEIERGFRKYGHFYVRKRRTKREVRALAGKVVQIVPKEQVAQAVAACDLDSSVVRNVGKEHLFDKDRYGTIFPTDAPLYYLTRYWALRMVSYVSKENREYGYAKWLVLHFLWRRLGPLIQSRSMAEAYVRSWNQSSASSADKAIRPVFVAALRFYRRKRGKGARAVDVSNFFKLRNHDPEFERYWGRATNKSRAKFNREWRQFVRELGVEAGN